MAKKRTRKKKPSRSARRASPRRVASRRTAARRGTQRRPSGAAPNIQSWPTDPMGGPPPLLRPAPAMPGSLTPLRDCWLRCRFTRRAGSSICRSICCNGTASVRRMSSRELRRGSSRRRWRSCAISRDVICRRSPLPIFRGPSSRPCCLRRSLGRHCVGCRAMRIRSRHARCRNGDDNGCCGGPHVIRGASAHDPRHIMTRSGRPLAF